MRISGGNARTIYNNNNLLLTEREGRTGEYWPEVVAVRTERSEVRTKTTEGQYSPVQLELARLVSSLLYGTRTMLVLSLPAFESKKNTQLMTVSTETVRMAKSRPRKNQSERSDLPCHIINNGNRTEWSPIRSVIILVINEIGRPRSGRFVNHGYDYRLN